MNEEHGTSRQSFFSRVFAGSTEGEGTSIYSSEEVGMPGTGEEEGLTAHGFTLEAAGIDIDELESSTRARESKLNSEIDLSENRIQQLKDETEEVIRSLEDKIRKAREARNFGVSEEERKISAAEAGLDNIDLVRGFFGLPQEEDADEPPADAAAGEETQVMEGVEEEDDTQVLRRPGPLSDSEDYIEPGDKKEQ